MRDRRADPPRGRRGELRGRDLERADPRDGLDRRRRVPARRRGRERARPPGRPRRLPREAPGPQPRPRRVRRAARSPGRTGRPSRSRRCRRRPESEEPVRALRLVPEPADGHRAARRSRAATPRRGRASSGCRAASPCSIGVVSVVGIGLGVARHPRRRRAPTCSGSSRSSPSSGSARRSRSRWSRPARSRSAPSARSPEPRSSAPRAALALAITMAAIEWGARQERLPPGALQRRRAHARLAHRGGAVRDRPGRPQPRGPSRSRWASSPGSRTSPSTPACSRSPSASRAARTRGACGASASAGSRSTTSSTGSSPRVIYEAYLPIGVWALLVFALPLLLMHQTQEAYLRHAERSTQKLREAAETIQLQNVSLEQVNRQLKERSTAAMESLSATVDARDSYTAGHSRRVQQIALAIGREFGMSRRRARGARATRRSSTTSASSRSRTRCCSSRRTLDESERALMVRHAEEGASIIDRLGFLTDAVPAIRHHHERYDGRGYPDGLAGEDIPLGARIIHVADAFDSMLSTRVYRPARSRDAALEELQQPGRDAVLPAVRRRARGDRPPRGRALAPRGRGRRRRRVAPERYSRLLAPVPACSTILGDGAEGRATARSRRSTREALAEFQAGIRKRYSDEQILAELRACAERLGRSPTMKEFAADPGTNVHPQTVIEHFGSWNAAKRAAGLVPRRFATRDELLGVLRAARRRARPDADRARPRRAPRPRAVEVALLAHVRVARERAARGGLRRRGGGGAARARGRPGRRARAGARAPAEVRRLGGGVPRGAARVDADRVAGLPDVRLAPRGVGEVPVPRPRAAARRGRRRSARDGSLSTA